ncbi:MAG: DinB family protein [Anaerolineae bacterium]|nr:DinB family protein [Anaerolineae bacterium]
MDTSQTLTQAVVEPWEIASRVTLFLLDGLPPDALTAKLTPRAWSVGQHFAHLHANRLAWMEGYKNLTQGLSRVPKEQAEDAAVLKAALEDSAQAVGLMLVEAVEAGKVKGFKRSPAAFMGYLVAHEGYHHGEIGVILAQTGHRLDDAVKWGLWEWDKR